MSIKIKDEKQEDILRVLTKGMVTIPKKWRERLAIQAGDRVRASLRERQIIVEPMEQKAPYRIYSQEELDEFAKNDTLPLSLKPKVKRILENG